MELEVIKSRLEDSKKFMDDLLAEGILSTTDYTLFCNVALRLDRKILKMHAKLKLLQNKLGTKVEQ